MYDWRILFIERLKGGKDKMEVIYNVKYKFKNVESKTKEEKKDIINKKLLNIIMTLESKELGLNNS